MNQQFEHRVLLLSNTLAFALARTSERGHKLHACLDDQHVAIDTDHLKQATPMPRENRFFRPNQSGDQTHRRRAKPASGLPAAHYAPYKYLIRAAEKERRSCTTHA
jgi:hypothetical protein